MAGTSQALLTVCGLLAAGIVPIESASADQDPVVAIHVKNPNELIVADLTSAQRLVTAIYAGAGVAIEWPVDQTATKVPTLTLILTTMASAPAGISPESMGVAPSPGDGTRGTTAYIFMDRVTSFVSRYKVFGEYVLACALAHEIGHLLLPPNAHSADGIMRGNWHPALFPPMSPGLLGFPPEQARLLRLRVQSR